MKDYLSSVSHKSNSFLSFLSIYSSYKWNHRDWRWFIGENSKNYRLWARKRSSQNNANVCSRNLCLDGSRMFICFLLSKYIYFKTLIYISLPNIRRWSRIVLSPRLRMFGGKLYFTFVSSLWKWMWKFLATLVFPLPLFYLVANGLLLSKDMQAEVCWLLVYFEILHNIIILWLAFVHLKYVHSFTWLANLITQTNAGAWI